ncbi:MAG: hypothetical protein ACOCWO_01425 [Candidatus Muiribacteriaceae bacterium]
MIKNILRSINRNIKKAVYFLLQKILLNILLTIVYFTIIPILRIIPKSKYKGFRKMDPNDITTEYMEESS